MDRFSNEIGWNSLSHSSLYAHSCPSSPRSSTSQDIPCLVYLSPKIVFQNRFKIRI
jgi:hypothetical protein